MLVCCTRRERALARAWRANAVALALAVSAGVAPRTATATTNLIIDTDIYSDVDDVGAVAIANAMADNGEVNLLGIVVDTNSQYAGSCVGVLLDYYGRPDVPIGTLKPLNDGAGPYDQALVQMFPTSLPDAAAAPDPVTLYRQILAAQPAQSVTIASVGLLTNLSALLESSPDSSSSLNGRDLVAQAVFRLVVMGGGYPTGDEFNFYEDPASAAYVVENWPTPIVFSGTEFGGPILSGNTLDSTVDASDPVRVAYDLYNGGVGRQSRDLTVVLYSVRPDSGLFVVNGAGGGNVVDETTGTNSWEAGIASNQTYLESAVPTEQFENVLNGLLVQPPRALALRDDASAPGSSDASADVTHRYSGEDAATDTGPIGEADSGQSMQGSESAVEPHPAAAASCDCSAAPGGPAELQGWFLGGLAASLFARRSRVRGSRTRAVDRGRREDVRHRGPPAPARSRAGAFGRVTASLRRLWRQQRAAATEYASRGGRLLVTLRS